MYVILLLSYYTVGSKLGEISTDSHEDDALTSPEKINISSISVEKLGNSSDSDSSTNLEPEVSAIDTPWTMQEDKILLENVQKEYSEKTFSLISSSLKNRSVDQVNMDVYSNLKLCLIYILFKLILFIFYR